jgi:hypothetical protein
MDIKSECGVLRNAIKDVGKKVWALKKHDFFDPETEAEDKGLTEKGDPIDRGEMKANIMLAYRHLEDARMRVGKVIQAYEGGVSHFDR